MIKYTYFKGKAKDFKGFADFKEITKKGNGGKQ